MGQRLEIARFHLLESGDVRLKSLANRQIPCRGNHRQRSAMETVRERNDFPFFGIMRVPAQARQLAGRLIGFSAAVAEKGLARKRVPLEPLGPFAMRLRVTSIAPVPARAGLLRRRGGKFRIAMAED